jgi:serine/threonine protein kinase
MLARKKIKCNFRLKRDDAIEEVAHLQRLSHAHIVRGVGTYTYKNELSILLYPATPYNLETFLELYEESRYFTRSLISKANGIIEFFACLSNTMSFVHGHLVKHMDIKPRNLLIKETRWEQGHRYKIYLADFGIARSYNTIDDVETDSLTHFSRIYAAPEVVRQDMRGFAADIFSLGCVFLEMVAALARKRDVLLDIRKQNLSGDDSYQANLPTLQEITLEMSRDDAWVPCTLDDYNPMIKAMLNYDPDLRPTAVDLKSYLNTDTWCCSQGQEPFEADMPFNTPIMESLSE